ncbi:MAG: T9SS type A sorting domain-containing protein [Saprospiraceae bacterium]|nr:T9SS type A sorting domain-containing protein [Saprospiraceae bacterium]
MYTTRQNESGEFFFRVKQVYANGYTRFSDVKQVSLKNSSLPKFIVTPNPSNGIVGIKFDNNEGGKMMLEIYNSQGQKVMQKEIVVSGTSYHQSCHVTRRSLLVEAYRRNEPTIQCQSTFH